MKKLLRKIKNFADKLPGNKSNELFWKFRHIFDRSNWSGKYVSEESLNHPHRKLLIDVISKYAPFQNIFEVGCASGPNLYLIAKKFPETKIYGSDISKNAIDFGKKWLGEQNIKNIELFTNYAENSLKNFVDKSIDIIFSDAALIYLNPQKITETFREMFRVGRKALIFIEQHTESSSPILDNHWIHNYKNLLAQFVSQDKIKLTKISKDIWAGNWAKYGYIIEVSLASNFSNYFIKRP